MRPLNILAIQLGFNDSFPDVSTLATTYNDGIYYVANAANTIHKTGGI